MGSQYFNIYFFVICFYVVINYMIYLLLLLQRMYILTVRSIWYLEQIVVLVYIGKSQVQCTLVQVLRFCTDCTAHRGSSGIALSFLDQGTRRGEWSAPRPALSLPRERPGTHCRGGWVDPRGGLDRCGKSRLRRGSIPRPSSPQPVVIPTELPIPQFILSVHTL